MRRILLPVCLFILLPAAGQAAQSAPGPQKAETPAAAQENPLSHNARFMYGGMKAILLRTLEKMPEEHYAFKPADSARTFAQIAGHIADSQRSFCSAVLGETNQAARIENAASTKAELTAAYKEVFGHCDRAFAGMTDAAAGQMASWSGREMPKLGLLALVNIHSAMHYGNLVTYMRIKGIVPPTSEPGFQPVSKQ